MVGFTFERLTDTYFYGIYGTFKLILEMDTWHVNATHLCQICGKNFELWFHSKPIQTLMEHFRERYNKTTSFQQIPLKDTAYYGKRDSGAGGPIAKLVAGTYLHPDLMPHLALWISPECAMTLCALQRTLWERTCDELRQESDYCCAELQHETKKYQLEIAQLKSQMETLRGDVIPKPDKPQLCHELIIMKMPTAGQYCAIRRQKRGGKSGIDQILNRYSGARRFIKIQNINPVLFYNAMKDRMAIRRKGNLFWAASDEYLRTELQRIIQSSGGRMHIEMAQPPPPPSTPR